jgi:hypothetical protein
VRAHALFEGTIAGDRDEQREERRVDQGVLIKRLARDPRRPTLDARVGKLDRAEPPARQGVGAGSPQEFLVVPFEHAGRVPPPVVRKRNAKGVFMVGRQRQLAILELDPIGGVGSPSVARPGAGARRPGSRTSARARCPARPPLTLEMAAECRKRYAPQPNTFRLLNVPPPGYGFTSILLRRYRNAVSGRHCYAPAAHHCWSNGQAIDEGPLGHISYYGFSPMFLPGQRILRFFILRNGTDSDNNALTRLTVDPNERDQLRAQGWQCGRSTGAQPSGLNTCTSGFVTP